MRIRIKLFNMVQNFLVTRGFVLSYSQRQLGRARAIDLYSKPDYIRFGAFELAAHEIINNGIQGSVAELGVYKAEFAKYINAAFPDRKLYLFDTFEGFDQNDLKQDKEKSFTKAKDDTFNDTSVELVLSKMKRPDQCIIRRGYFPETATGLEDEQFAFVSLDADLYAPLYEGLTFFYPRLSKGGYIFVHDYNNTNYRGANSSVKTFCTENDIRFFPLCDAYGSAIITK